MKKHFRYIALLALFAPLCTNASAQNEVKSDSIKVKAGKDDDRNIMLNAADNRGPREVNIGLPASVGGTTIIENGLPVVYYFWPEMPTSVWRTDASIGKMGVLKVGEAAITTGDLGFAVDSYTNLGSDNHQVRGQANVNHYGMNKTSLNVSGPISKEKGWYYTTSALVNLDPGNYDIKFRTWEDNTQIYRAGVTKRFGGKGEISLLYKFARSSALTNYGPFRYEKDGEVKEYNGFELGKDSYYAKDGKITVRDIFTGEYMTKDFSKGDSYTHSNTFDLMGKYNFDNGMKLNYVLRYHDARSVTASIRPQSVTSNVGDANSRIVYTDNGEVYNGEYVQSMVAKFSNKIPVRSFTSRIELVKKTDDHNWRIGFNEWFYQVDKFADNSATFLQEVAPNPRRLERETYDAASNTWVKDANSANGFYGFNSTMGYHDGQENKVAIYMNDTWTVNNKLDISAGARFTLYTLSGNYLPYNRNKNQYFDQSKPDLHTVKFDNTWFMKAFTFNTVYKITSKFGALAEFTYNEDRPHLENYSGSVEPSLKSLSIPMGQLGLYYNHDKVSVVSAFTYAKKTNYQKRLTLSNPTNEDITKSETTYYDIETLGWTTDIVATPFKNFNLHLLLTVQAPKYKNYKGDVEFDDISSGSSILVPYDYDGKIVNGISKILIEIDPSYQWKNFKIWGSARYFSKQYANLSNALYFAGRWETFAGINYKHNKNFDYGLTFVNLLGERGAKGSINGADLITDASQIYGNILSGSYIRPFTVEASVKFKF